ncbi:MAG: acyl-CoA reductase [Algoriphagus sp.]|nr:acyl-CoA reductase [Algoriphagus sp.]
MNLSERVSAFVQLGILIKNLSENEREELFWRAENKNSWFTPSSCQSALNGIAFMIAEEKLSKWLSVYGEIEPVSPKSIGIMMAGNIPAVGFHDLMAVVISGNKACVKLSSADEVLMKWIIKSLISIEPRFAELVEIEEMLKTKDAYIATGSDNSARYFNYYFGKYPSIIRRNRTSVAVLSGNESTQELQALGKDIFQYFGLGCRNVSKIFIKSKDQLQHLLDSLEVFSGVMNHHKYLNNYDYNKSILLVNREDHLDNGFLLVRETKELVSPIAVLFYEIYSDLAQLQIRLEEIKENIQCIVSNPEYFEGAVPFGGAQEPEVWDYADGEDTVRFLQGLN